MCAMLEYMTKYEAQAYLQCWQQDTYSQVLDNFSQNSKFVL